MNTIVSLENTIAFLLVLSWLIGQLRNPSSHVGWGARQLICRVIWLGCRLGRIWRAVHQPKALKVAARTRPRDLAHVASCTFLMALVFLVTFAQLVIFGIAYAPAAMMGLDLQQMAKVPPVMLVLFWLLYWSSAHIDLYRQSVQRHWPKLNTLQKLHTSALLGTLLTAMVAVVYAVLAALRTSIY